MHGEGGGLMWWEGRNTFVRLKGNVYINFNTQKRGACGGGGGGGKKKEKEKKRARLRDLYCSAIDVVLFCI